MMSEETTNNEDPGYLGIAEVVEITGISAFTIRYYDKCGFFPNLKRSKRGVRSFSSEDVHQLRLVDALRRSGLSIDGIAYFTRLTKKGDATIADRLSVLQSQTMNLEYQIEEARDGLTILKNELDALTDRLNKQNG